jgi:hypothetical protein
MPTLVVIFKQHDCILRVEFEDEVQANQALNVMSNALMRETSIPFWRNNRTVVDLATVAAVTLV